VGEAKLKHFVCSNGGEFAISPDAEKVALGSSPSLREHMLMSAQQSDDERVLVITLPEGKPSDLATGLILRFAPRSELAK
jgi:hypothetical protein